MSTNTPITPATPPTPPPAPLAPPAPTLAAPAVDTATQPPAAKGQTEPARVAAEPGDDEPKPKARAKAKPINLKSEYVAADKDHDNALSRSELKLNKKAFKEVDRNDDGKASISEYRAEARRENSFKGLDKDEDGKLSAGEMKDLRRFTSEEDNTFDKDGDGDVSREEFIAARKADVRANREARREQDWKKLGAEDKKELARYDADDDGKISLDEYHAGRKKDWVDGRTKKMNHLFEAAGGKDGKLDVTKAKQYKAYDADGDGSITKEEFEKGFLADRKAFWNDAYDKGEIPKAMQKRLGLDENGMGLNHVPKPKPAKQDKAAGHTKGAEEKTIDTPAGPMVKREGGMIAAGIADNFDRMVAAAKKDGISLEINSGFRTRAEQAALYAQYGPGRAAPPGQSNHEDGNAIDFTNNPGAYDWLAKNASQFGLHNLPGEPWHYSINGH